MSDKNMLAEKVKEANDVYHEAINLVMENKDFDVKVKAKIGHIACRIFGFMDDINIELEKATKVEG